jgi:hypothetical protein
LQRDRITTVYLLLTLLDPIFNVPPSTQNNKDPSYLEKFAFYAHPNIWPSSLPALKPAFMDLGELIVSVGSLVARQCDDFVSQKYPNPLAKNFLTSAIEKSETVKARLLHYFPISETDMPNGGKDMDSWCGLHIDSSMVFPFLLITS